MNPIEGRNPYVPLSFVAFSVLGIIVDPVWASRDATPEMLIENR